jgi:spore germination protein
MASGMEQVTDETRRLRQRALMVIALSIAIVLISVGGIRLITKLDKTILSGAEAPTQQSIVSVVRHSHLVGRPAVNGLPPGMVLGYFYDPGNAGNAAAMLQHYLPVLTGIIPFWYTIYANGSISGQTNPAVLQLAESHNLWTFALVENMAGQPVFGPLLNSEVARRRAIDNMLTLVEDNGYDGINLDWEGIAPSERSALTSFVQQLCAVFHRHGYYVTLSLPAETSNQPYNGWTGAYNYAALAKSADLLMIMAYDEHYAGGSPGPIAAPSWVQSVLNYAISVIPPSKIILGIPGYGYDWGGSQTVALSYGQAESLKSQYGLSGSSNHFEYVQDGQVHTVWFENTTSFLSKINLVTGYELRGIALWRLGIEDPKIWNFLQ